MQLSEATWTEVADLDGDFTLLPAGSTEQHGPHAPPGADVLNAESVAEISAGAFDGKAVIGPAVPVSVAEERRAFDGTLWVSPGTFHAYVRETVEPLAHHDFDRVVVIDGHGGNIDALTELCQRISRTGDVYAVAFAWFDTAGGHSSDMGHGGPLETALLRHVRPELAREDRIDEAHDGSVDRWGEWVSGANLAYDSDEFTDNGVVGDPAKGDVDRGAEPGSLAADSLAPLLDAVESRKLD